MSNAAFSGGAEKPGMEAHAVDSLLFGVIPALLIMVALPVFTYRAEKRERDTRRD